MPKQATVYAYAVVAIGALSFVAAALQWTSQSPTRFVICLLLALLGSTMKVKLPGTETCVCPSFVPFLFAVGTMSWQEAVVIAAAGGILQTLWKPKRKPMPIQVFFNAANLLIAVGVSHAVSSALAQNQTGVRLAIAAVVFDVLNTLNVATVLCLLSGSPLSGVWRSCHFWAFPYHLVGAALAAVWAQTETAVGFSVTAIVAVTLYLMSAFYQELVARNGMREAA
jgi:hypothetical protein